jgi:hypothetical protein
MARSTITAHVASHNCIANRRRSSLNSSIDSSDLISATTDLPIPNRSVFSFKQDGFQTGFSSTSVKQPQSRDVEIKCPIKITVFLSFLNRF